MARAALAGPVPEPVLPIFSLRLPRESSSIWDESIIPQFPSMYARPPAPNCSISSLRMAGFITTPGPIITLARRFRKPLGSMRIL